MVEIDQSEWHIWVWYHYVAIFQRRYLKPWLESLLSWWPAAAQLLSHYISKQLWGGGTTIEQTLTEDFHRTEKLENCPGNKTFIYLFYIAGLLFEVLPTKMQTLSLFLQYCTHAHTPYNACYLFMVKLSLSVPTILSSSVSFLFGFQLKLWCLSGISYHFSHRR